MATIKISGDEVQIDNIATEKTLRDIGKALNVNFGAGGKFDEALDKMGGKAEDTGGILEQGARAAATAVSGTAKSIVEVGVAAFDSSARLSTATGALKDNFGEVGKAFGGPLNAVVAGAEGYVDTFRQLSQSGAAFSADIFEMKNSAAQSRLSLDEFSTMITKNSEGLAAMGGSVSRGARLFTMASKDFFESSNGYAEQLSLMGMNSADMNDALMFQMQIQRRANMEDEGVRRATNEAAFALAKEMDTVAKLTGKQKDEIQAEIAASQRKGQVEAKFRKIEMEQGAEAAQAARASYAQALASAQKAGPDAVAALEETFTLGQVRSEEASRGIVALGGAADELQGMMRRISADPLNADVDNLVNNFDAALVQRINSAEFLDMAIIADTSPVAQAAATMLENAGDFATAVGKTTEGELQTRQQILDAVLKAKDLAQKEAEGKGADGERTAGTEATRAIANAELRLKDMGAVINDNLLGKGGALQGFEGELRASADALAGIDTKQINDTIGAKMKDIQSALGLSVEDQAGPQEPYPSSEEEVATTQSMIDAIRQLNASQELSQDQVKTAKILLDSLLRDDLSKTITDSINSQAQSQDIPVEDVVQAIVKKGDFKETSADIAQAANIDEQRVSRRARGFENIPLQDMVKEVETQKIENVVLDPELTSSIQDLKGIVSTMNNQTAMLDKLDTLNTTMQGLDTKLGQNVNYSKKIASKNDSLDVFGGVA